MSASPVLLSTAAPGRPFIFASAAEFCARWEASRRLAAIAPASALQVRTAPEMVSSGIPELDALTGGWPRGCLSEICGPASSGRTTVMLAALAQATQRGEVCALVDASDALDPASAGAAGIEMQRLLWIRCGKKNSSPSHSDPEKFNKRSSGKVFESELDRKEQRTSAHRLEQVLKITDLLLQSSGFGTIALDLGDIPVRSARRIPLASWFRFRRAVEHTPTVLLVLEQQPIAGSCSSVLLRVSEKKLSALSSKLSERKYLAFRSHLIMNQGSEIRLPQGLKPTFLADFSGTAEAAPFQNRFMRWLLSTQHSQNHRTHTELLDKCEITAELLRSRLDRKPPQSAMSFVTRARWAG